jgi:hypothetical protein
MTVFVTAAPAHVPRKDALPEGLQARALCGHVLVCGCEGVAACCFDCLLPRCRYDGNHRGIVTVLNESRDREIAKLRAVGLTVDGIASRFHLSRRSVFRVLRLCRPGGEP